VSTRAGIGIGASATASADADDDWDTLAQATANPANRHPPCEPRHPSTLLSRRATYR
jgi:hypothetical protein